MARRVLIIGGGTGATMLANTLNKRTFEVTVLTSSLEHMFQPALLYVAFKDSRVNTVRDERSLLSRHVRLVHDRVTNIDLRKQEVTTASGSQYGYDDLVVGTGVRTDPGQIPGLTEVNAQFGDYHSTLAWAHKLWANLENFQGGTIVLGQASPICKCPPSPVEGILLIDELLTKRGIRDKTRLVFFSPYPRPYPAAPMNEIVEPIMRERGVEIMTFFDLDRIDPETKTIYSIEGDEIQYDLPIIIPPFIGANISYEPAEVLDQSRLLKTDKLTLRVMGFDNVYAIGDGTNLPTSKSGVGAHLEAKVVASMLAGKPAAFGGRTHCPVDLAYGKGTFVIGSYDAPVVKLQPSRLNHLMKMMFGRIYWISLRGLLEPMFDVFFKLTAPKPPKPEQRPTAGGETLRP
ncbi:MAG: FAD/NAD(P)-binding oxidoreductase [Nitrolancea sp.]